MYTSMIWCPSIPLQAACVTKLRDFLMRHRKDYINSAGYVSVWPYTCNPYSVPCL